MKILVAIESCFKDIHKHQVQRDTWMKDLPFMEKRFFIGNCGFSPLEDETFLGADIDDSYEGLSLKTRAICQWAAGRDFDFVFKMDTDTVMHPKNFFLSGFGAHDYSGGFNTDCMPDSLKSRFPQRLSIDFASGGAGYWLSKKALTIIANSDKVVSCAEDVFVAAVLREHGIQPTFNSGYRWRPGETVDKDLITLHLSSALQKKYEPKDMYQAYEEIKRLN
jgi:hypothetical protein